MFKYLAFCALFLFAIFTSFWVFVWSWRTELVSVLIERSCPPCKAHVQHVEWVDTQTLKISELSFRDQTDTELAFISEAQLTASPFSWLRWLLIPSKKPLSLSKLLLYVENTPAYTFKPGSLPIFPLWESPHWAGSAIHNACFKAPQAPLFITADEVIITSANSDRSIPKQAEELGFCRCRTC